MIKRRFFSSLSSCIINGNYIGFTLLILYFILSSLLHLPFPFFQYLPRLGIHSLLLATMNLLLLALKLLLNSLLLSLLFHFEIFPLIFEELSKLSLFSLLFRCLESRSKGAAFEFLSLFFFSQQFKFFFFSSLLIFYSALDFRRVKASSVLVAEMLLFFHLHEVFLRNQNVSPLLLLVVEFLDKLAVSLVEISLSLRVMRALMRLSLFKFLLVGICLIDEITIL